VDGQPDILLILYSCVHCKTCDIKVPDQDITWRTPQVSVAPVDLFHLLTLYKQGGEGPKYVMT
jgi:electron-transferring-flavoprotein dehydrogenase